jgi:hypothetical protein
MAYRLGSGVSKGTLSAYQWSDTLIEERFKFLANFWQIFFELRFNLKSASVRNGISAAFCTALLVYCASGLDCRGAQ